MRTDPRARKRRPPLPPKPGQVLFGAGWVIELLIFIIPSFRDRYDGHHH